MQSANIGDSGYVVLGTTRQKREFHVKYHTPQQEHSFGCPYQLGHGDNADHPDSAMLASLPVHPCSAFLPAACACCHADPTVCPCAWQRALAHA